MATAATPTSSPEQTPLATPQLVPRFGRSERALHWVHAAGFFAMLGSGLVLYLPGLSASIGDRPTTRAIHLGVSVAWMTALALVSVGGDRRALRQTRREMEHYLDGDLQWLRGKKVPQGRFNAGQKTHAVLQSALAALFVLSGVLLWLGERSTSFRLPGTVALHDGAMFVSVALVAGHLFLSLVWPATRPALRGIVRGTVRGDWAARHHAAWTPAAQGRAQRSLSPRRWAVCVLLLLAGGTVTALVFDESLSGSGSAPPSSPSAAPAPARTPEPPLKPGADTLAIQAQELAQGGRYPEAIELLRQAVRQAPDRARIRASLGFTLAQAGDLVAAETELERAVRLDDKAPDAHFYLGAVRVSAGKRRSGRSELRRYLRLAPRGANAASARRLLRQR